MALFDDTQGEVEFAVPEPDNEIVEPSHTSFTPKIIGKGLTLTTNSFENIGVELAHTALLVKATLYLSPFAALVVA